MTSITFDPIAHAYAMNGETVPSVTQVLQPLLLLERVRPEILSAARDFGRNLHAALAMLVRNVLDVEALDRYLVPYVNAGKRFLTETKFRVIASEMVVYSKPLQCAGTLDLLGELRGIETVVDWKSANVVFPTVGPQTAAYEAFYRESRGGRVRQRYCVQLMPDDYRVTRLDDPADFDIFKSALNLYHWRKRRGFIE